MGSIATETIAPPAPSLYPGYGGPVEISSKADQPRVSLQLSSAPQGQPALSQPSLEMSQPGHGLDHVPFEEPTCMQSIKKDYESFKEFAGTRYRKLTWRAIGAFCQRRLPITEWIPEYRLWKFWKDLQAGLVVACMLIPQGMGYSDVAGLPFVAGCWFPSFSMQRDNMSPSSVATAWLTAILLFSPSV
jgi:hypothetical protein